MSFLDPAAFIFALSLPVVLAFYLLKRKRVVRLVSSIVLWQRYCADTQANAPFQKLRKSWLLLLQLLLLALATFALARPFLAGNARESPLRVLILDGSASMQATDEKPNRFEKARRDALEWIAGLRDGERIMVLLAGASTEVKQSPTGDKAALRRALASCEPSDCRTLLADALKTAGAFTFERRGEETVTTGEIHLFSDGSAPDLDEFATKNLPLVYHRVGTRNHNLGIVRIDTRSNPENTTERAVFVNVSNFSSNSVGTAVDLLFDGRFVATRSLVLGPMSGDRLLFTTVQTNDGVFTVRLNAQDDLAVDNEASVVSLLPRPSRVLLVTRGNRFLEKALAGSAQARIDTTAQLSDPADNYDVVVLDNVTPLVWPRANVLAFHTAHTNLFSTWAVAATPTIVDWKTSHPLMRFVSLDNVQIAETLAVNPPSWGLPLVESSTTPLVIAGELKQQRIVWVGFDLLQSTWPLRVSFPIFAANAVDWLNPAANVSDRLLVQPGTTFRWPVFPPVSYAEVRLPDGRASRVPIQPGARELLVSDTARCGIYHVTVGTNQVTFCANLMDASESNIAPKEEIMIGKYDTVAAATLRRANAELWRWIAAAGLVVLIFEWWFYHRRSV